MKWIDKNPPLYVWPGDEWYNERDKMIYTCDIEKREWVNADKRIDFLKKTKVFLNE
jgi:hypothetical protein